MDSFAEMLEERNLNDFVSNFNCESGFLSSGSTTLPYTKTSMKNKKGMLHCITNEPQLPLCEKGNRDRKFRL